MYRNFTVERADGIVTLTLSRPEKRNPINEEMLSEFEQITLALRDDADARAVILTGMGHAFCAGADLSIVKGVTDPNERQRLFAQARHRRARLIGRSFALFENLEQVTIAAINGYAIGGGWGLALTCDFRIAVPGAQFWLPEVDLGVPLGLGSTSRLVSMLGPARAKEIILTCERYRSEDLFSWGMINRIVPPEVLLEAARDLAKQLIVKNPRAVAGSKLTVNAIAAVAAREMTTVQPELFLHP
ncbi:MAG TPA: enoyl-CoA hydratase/isomerase family protein [Alphaproteobacteria bacterium]|nr:enoyl-CoA hydratase/isomerase family protein [Alphaproteobacteria bacterium]